MACEIKTNLGDLPPYEEKENDSVKSHPVGKRHMQTIILFLTLVVCYIMRAQMSVTLVAMIDVKTVENGTEIAIIDSNTSAVRVEDRSKLNDNVGWNVYQTYKWTKSMQDMIGGSFFAGYCIMNIPMGIFSQKFGGKIPLLVALFVNSVISIITPWTPIVGGYWALCVCRFIQGLTQAALFPGIHTILGHWVPLSERGRLSTYVYTGTQLGTTAAFQLAGYVSAHPMLGWPVMFWGCGCLGFVIFVFLYYFGAATPAEHPSITEEEKLFIMDGVPEEKYTDKRITPWKQILSSLPLWAAVIAHLGSGFGFLVCLIEMPVYMNHVLNVNIKQSGLFSSLPYISMYVFGLIFGQLCDFLVNRKYMRMINMRRLGTTLGVAISGLLMLSFAYANTVPLAITLLVLSFGFHSGMHVGFHINYIDLSPNFAGTLMSLGNTVASSMGVVAPMVVAIIVKDTSNQAQWQTVFIITAVIMCVTNLVFVIFAKTDVQPWNDLALDDSKGCKYEKINKVIFASPDIQL